MKNKIVEQYLDEILYSRLIKLDVKEKYAKEIIDSVRERIYSILYHWKDVSFRKSLLIIGIEEAMFYEPEADLDIKCFVVVTIRNSLLEMVFSVEHVLMELEKPIPEPNVKLITSEAINYFKNIDFNNLSEEISKEKIDDFYRDIVKKYPMAWRAINQLSNCNGKKVQYEKLNIENKINYEQLQENEQSNKKKRNTIVETQSGINEKFSKQLLDLLKGIIESENGVFYVDCFKMASRNFEKLMKIIEILLENNKMFLTSNFLITNSYIGKRQQLYRAAHNEKGLIKNVEDKNFLLGLSKTHATALNIYTQVMKKEIEELKGL